MGNMVYTNTSRDLSYPCCVTTRGKMSGTVSYYVMSLVIDSLGVGMDTHTHTHTHTLISWTKIILGIQAYAGFCPVNAWFNLL